MEGHQIGSQEWIHSNLIRNFTKEEITLFLSTQVHDILGIVHVLRLLYGFTNNTVELSQDEFDYYRVIREFRHKSVAVQKEH